VFLSVVALALTLPAEVILLKALQQTSDKEAAQEWVNGLSAADLDTAADAIQGYSFNYRKEIMRAVKPERRAAIWQRHLEQYVKGHPELDAAAVDLLRSAQAGLTARALSQPTDEDRAAIKAVAGQIEAVLGRDEAIYLLHDLGPRQQVLAGAEPLSLKLATLVRHQFALLARSEDCDCADDFGCGGYSEECTSEYCQWDVDWPMCGWGWMDVCTGLCGTW
jgi:hypothetical protein